MGAQKSQPLWVDPDRVPPPTSVLYEQAEPEVLFNSNGVPVYPKASGIGYTPYRDPLPELPTVYDNKGKPIRPKAPKRSRGLWGVRVGPRAPVCVSVF